MRTCGRAVGFVFALFVGTYAPQATADDAEYLRDIRPLLEQRCFACHGVLKQEASLRLDTGAMIRAGGDSGEAVSPGEPNQSLLIERVAAISPDERMPPEGESLTPSQIKTLRSWIADGAKSPEDEQPEADPRDHWSFKPLTRPAVPTVPGTTDAGNAIDSFIDRVLRKHGVKSQSAAPKNVLLRRAYVDLVGLPPTPDELHAFLADDTDEAWANVVDRLLDDPRHAERWARHWMDIWRYADWYGRRNVPDVWNSAPQVWRWRDWIVQSINEDKGYDQMISEMLAADEICPDDREASYATGFLVRNWYALNPNDWMRANVEHTGKAFLGLTFNCAHCHDHKYDPISHDDYFRMRAFFEPLYVRQDRVPGEADPGPFQDYDYSTVRKIQQLGSVSVFDKTPDAPTWFYSGGDERNREQDRGSIAPGVPAFLDSEALAIESIDLPPVAWYPGLDASLQQTMLDDARLEVSNAESKLAETRQAGVEVSQTSLDQLEAAQAAHAAALNSRNHEGRLTAITGKQSLVFEAIEGRRVLQNRLPQVKEFGEGFTIHFQLLLATDTHFNFQLAKDIDKGLTGSLVAFEKGRVVCYQPGTTTEFEAGRYDFSAGQNLFRVELVVRPARDQCLLTIHSVSDDKMLVADTPVALNGWNPVTDPTKGIFLDAQTGCIAAIDELILQSAPLPTGQESQTPDSESASEKTNDGLASHSNGPVHFSFEPPTYLVGRDVIGTEHWETSSFGSAPATSVVAAALKDATLSELERKLESARRRVQIPELRMQAAEARLAATRAALASLEARIAADRVKYGQSADSDSLPLAIKAAESERQARLSELEANSLRDQHAVAVAEAKSDSEKNRATEVAAANKRLATSKSALEKVQAAQRAKQSEEYTPLTPIYPQTSTGRRQALAGWITSRDNPLTARVAVNHIWMRHFHAPLVQTVYDFGRNGSDPTHPDLLDWLAVELIDSGWSMKHIHRLILTSKAYRRSSSASLAGLTTGLAANENGTEIDNQLLWRMNTGRMEAEVIRDSLLHCGDLLDFTMGGRPLGNDQALRTYRRSLYYEAYPEDGGTSELSDLFDAPSPLDCYRRTRSIVPQQALALTNSGLVHQVAATMVDNWAAGSATPADSDADANFVTDMFEKILTRTPTDAELQLCLHSMKTQRDILRQDASEKQTPSDQVSTNARRSLVRALLNHNDFVTVR